MSSTLDAIKKPIADELEHFNESFKEKMTSSGRLLNCVVYYALKCKGKQLRPILVFLSAKLSGLVTDKTYTAASLIELLHTATLVHDDVVDESFYRRGLFSVFGLWKSKIAVLLGDFFLARGLLIAMEDHCYDVLNIVSESVKEMAEGELFQLEKSRRLNISENEYYEIIRKKTAVLIAACTAAGAVSAGASNFVVERLKLFGEYIGMAFQIKDDLFDYQQTGLIGKPKFNDIQERKLTLPLIWSLDKSSFPVRRRIISLLRKRNKKNEDISQIVDFVMVSGGVEYSINVMNNYKAKALKILEDFEDSDAKLSLINLAEFVVMRNA